MINFYSQFLCSVMGRLEDVYHRANEVVPERWFGENSLEYDQYRFPVFQAGPRICLGKDLALMEAKLCVVELVRRYRVSLAEEPPSKLYIPGLTLSYRGDLALKFDRR